MLPGLLVGEDPVAADRLEDVEPAVELPSAGGHLGVADTDLGADGGLGDQEFELGVFKWRAHVRIPSESGDRGLLNCPGF